MGRDDLVRPVEQQPGRPQGVGQVVTAPLQLGGEAAVQQHQFGLVGHDVRLRSMTTTTEPTTAHRETLERALTAIRERTYWSAYPENLKAYGEESGTPVGRRGQGRVRRLPRQAVPAAAVRHRRRGRRRALAVRPRPRRHLPARRRRRAARRRHGRASRPGAPPGPDARAELALEILQRINARSHEMAQAVMHTSGQAYAMAFQAGGPHAQDRALEAVAYAYAEMTRHAAQATWEKPQGKRPPQRMTKTLHRRAARRRAGDRLQHLPDLELLPRACSPAWSPATRWS